MIINHLEQMFQLVSDTRIAFIYFNHKESPSAGDLLGNILKQILQQQTDIPSAIRDIYSKHRKRISRPSFPEITDLLVLEASKLSKLFVVIDALDECPTGPDTKDKVLSQLRKLSALRLLVTSRPYVSVSPYFDFLRLDIRAHQSDIERFIQARLEKSEHLKQYIDEDFKNTIVHGIIEKCAGM